MNATLASETNSRVGNRLSFEQFLQVGESTPRESLRIANPDLLTGRNEPEESSSPAIIIDALSISFPNERNVKSDPVVASRVRIEQATSKILGLWEGYVSHIDDEVFTARLVDLENNEPDHNAEFDIASVSDSDRDLLKEGAVFYWSICYNKGVAGQITTTSDIRFRRRPVWTEVELREAKQNSEDLKELFQLHTLSPA